MSRARLADTYVKLLTHHPSSRGWPEDTMFHTVCALTYMPGRVLLPTRRDMEVLATGCVCVAGGFVDAGATLEMFRSSGHSSRKSTAIVKRSLVRKSPTYPVAAGPT